MSIYKYIGNAENDIVTIFLIDDDKIDRASVRRAFHKANILNPIQGAGDGEEGLELLRKNKAKQVVPAYLILLDLNMPKMNGIEFLEELRKDPEFKNAPVVILTTSHSDEDKLVAHELGAIGYVTKSDADKDLLAIIESLPEKFCLCEMR